MKVRKGRDRRPHKRRQRMRKLGWTVDAYETKLVEQRGLCAICHRKDPPRRLAADHNHETMKPRGLLCRACNVGLGNFKENIDHLLAAVYYLEHHNG